MNFVEEGDLAIIAAPTDWLGVNYYTRSLVKAGENGFPSEDRPNATLPRHRHDWEIYPDGFYKLLCRLHFEYRIPSLVITENGAAYNMGVGSDGPVNDPDAMPMCAIILSQSTRRAPAGSPVHEATSTGR